MKKLWGFLLVITLLTLCGCGGSGGPSGSPTATPAATPTPTPTPVNRELTADANTVALWLFNEGSGQTVADSSGNGRSLVLGNSASVETIDPAWADAGRSGFGNCLTFTASDNEWASRNTGNSFPTDSLTIEGWIKTTSTAQSTFFGNSGSVVEVVPTAGGNIWFIIWDSVGATWRSLVSNGTINDGQWHYVACTYNHVRMKIFIDGVVDNTLAVVIDVSDLPDYYVGGRANFLDGSVDSMRISNVARTAPEIADYYQQATQ